MPKSDQRKGLFRLRKTDEIERCGAAIIYLVTLRLFRFFWRQPRLAVVTRTLLLALPALGMLQPEAVRSSDVPAKGSYAA